jgi:hypothetical protein
MWNVIFKLGWGRLLYVIDEKTRVLMEVVLELRRERLRSQEVPHC